MFISTLLAAMQLVLVPLLAEEEEAGGLFNIMLSIAGSAAAGGYAMWVAMAREQTIPGLMALLICVGIGAFFGTVLEMPWFVTVGIAVPAGTFLCSLILILNYLQTRSTLIKEEDMGDFDNMPKKKKKSKK